MSPTAPVAKVYGAPLITLPENLYIPPDALRVFLEETFEGPLDLLLYLIRRRNLDIMAISIAQVTEQYLEYIALMEGLKIELAAEYLLMAAILAEIKSRLLLPQPTAEAEEEDPRAELVRRLKEYERFKQAAAALDELPRIARDVFPVCVDPGISLRPKAEPRIGLEELAAALRQVLARAERFCVHAIEREALSVRGRMADILDRLRKASVLAFESLFDPGEGRAGIVVTFLALLELCREGLVEILQSEPLAPLRVQLR
jgi:segregation and condensation protein A